MPAAAPPPSAPVRKLVGILKEKIDAIETDKDRDDAKPLLEFAWELVKQATGIAVLADNDAKKQARKDVVARRARDLRIVAGSLAAFGCLSRLAEPDARREVLALRLADEEQLEAVERVAAAAFDPDRPFEERIDEAARLLFAVVDDAPEDDDADEECARVRAVLDAVRRSGYLDRAPPAEDEPTPPVRAPSPPRPPTPPPQAAPPPPAPAFAVLSPVTLQQVEHAYFAQYAPRRPPHPNAPEVIGPQSFIFLQESELDGERRQPTPPPPPPPPAQIPSQTFTNQTYLVEYDAPPPPPPPAFVAYAPPEAELAPAPAPAPAPTPAPAQAPPPPAEPERAPLEIDEWNPTGAGDGGGPRGGDRYRARGRGRGPHRGGRAAHHHHHHDQSNGHHHHDDEHRYGDERRPQPHRHGVRGGGGAHRYQNGGGPRGPPRGGPSRGSRPHYQRKTGDAHRFEQEN